MILFFIFLASFSVKNRLEINISLIYLNVWKKYKSEGKALARFFTFYPKEIP